MHLEYYIHAADMSANTKGTADTVDIADTMDTIDTAGPRHCGPHGHSRH